MGGHTIVGFDHIDMSLEGKVVLDLGRVNQHFAATSIFAVLLCNHSLTALVFV